MTAERLVALNPRILIVDDSGPVRDSFRKILADNGNSSTRLETVEQALFDVPDPPPAGQPFQLEYATQGNEAFDLVQEAIQRGLPYSVAFVDIRMPPGWDGIETTGHLWKVDPDLQVVICTAYADYSWEQMTSCLGTSDRLVILKKPFETIEVLQLATALTEKWRLHQEAKVKLRQLEALVEERTRSLRETNHRLETEIGERQRAESERERLIIELKKALANVRTLRGLVPICAACKKIRDDKGYWNQVETYVAAHSSAEFTHSICPECAHKIFPEFQYPSNDDTQAKSSGQPRTD